MDPLAWIDEELSQREGDGLLRRLTTYDDSPTSALIASDGRQLVNFASNDYLHLARDPRLATAVRAALERHAWGSGASPLITGHTTCHAELEQQLALFEPGRDFMLQDGRVSEALEEVVANAMSSEAKGFARGALIALHGVAEHEAEGLLFKAVEAFHLAGAIDLAVNDIDAVNTPGRNRPRGSKAHIHSPGAYSLVQGIPSSSRQVRVSATIEKVVNYVPVRICRCDDQHTLPIRQNIIRVCTCIE